MAIFVRSPHLMRNCLIISKYLKANDRAPARTGYFTFSIPFENRYFLNCFLKIVKINAGGD